MDDPQQSAPHTSEIKVRSKLEIHLVCRNQSLVKIFIIRYK